MLKETETRNRMLETLPQRTKDALQALWEHGVATQVYYLLAACNCMAEASRYTGCLVCNRDVVYHWQWVDGVNRELKVTYCDYCGWRSVPDGVLQAPVVRYAEGGETP